MKNKLFLIAGTLFCASFIFSAITFAQDHTQWGLPEGAKARLGKGHIINIAYSPDGTRLAVASSIGIWIYDTATNEASNLFTGHTRWIVSLSFSPDGTTLASGDTDGTIHLWDVATGKQLRTLEGHTSWVVSMAFSPDGTLASWQWGWHSAAVGTYLTQTSATHRGCQCGWYRQYPRFGCCRECVRGSPSRYQWGWHSERP